jgi:cullin-associated NEDD8-dissociated protein 1
LLTNCLQLATCFNKIDLPAFTDRVMASLQDVNEIKVLGLMLLLRLGQLAPTTVIPRLDDAAEPLRLIMKDVEVKEDTVKQDLERKGSCKPLDFPKRFQ